MKKRSVYFRWMVCGAAAALMAGGPRAAGQNPDLAASRGAASAAAPDYASLAEILVQRITGMLRADAPQNLSYQEERVREELDGAGEALRTTRAKYRWRIQSGRRERQLFWLDGTELEKPFEPEGDSSSLQTEDFQRIVRQFEFQLVGVEGLHDRQVLHTRFFPKKKQSPAKGRLERVLMRLQGDSWISIQDRELLKASVRLSRPVRWAGGILGAVSKLEIDYSQRPVGAQWRPDSFRFEISMRELFRKSRIREIRRYAEVKH